MSPEASIPENILASVRSVLVSLSFLGPFHHGLQPTTEEAHLQDYRDLLNAGDSRLNDSTASFLFLHMPIPHPGGIYNRAQGNLTTSNASYLDNLALADRYLAHVHQLLSERDEWDSAAVIIMGDHSWRTHIWDQSSAWTAEDDVASQHGQFDDRPAYIVKLPLQNQPKHMDTPYSARNTRALLQGIVSGNIRSTSNLEAFVQSCRRR
jgi:membrane-anchored protein YejM (alkaline phosphatase superfamily)